MCVLKLIKVMPIGHHSIFKLITRCILSPSEKAMKEMVNVVGEDEHYVKVVAMMAIEAESVVDLVEHVALMLVVHYK